ncbi:MAG: MFS transporter [Chloroflexota bacterium]|nr:MFS transporter [Chloroflexota bacterium]
MERLAVQKGQVASVMGSLALCMLLPSLGTSIANVALPTLATTFSASFQEVQWVVIAYLLATTILVVSVGRLGDVFGRRQLLLLGILLFTAGSAAAGAAPALEALIAARALQGLGAAAMLALTLAFVSSTMPAAQVGRAMGMLGALSAIGTALGPSLGGLLIAGLGWQWIFLINVPLGLFTLTLAWRYLPADPVRADGATPFDVKGSVLLALALAAYALSMTLGDGEFGYRNAALIGLAATALALFLVVEKRAVAPLVGLATLRGPGLASSLLVSALVATVMMTTLIVGPFYLSIGVGLGTAHVGLAMSAGPAVAALTGVPAGRIVDRFGAHRMTVAALAGMALGGVALAMMPAARGIVGYLLPLMLLTSSYALLQTANNTAVMRDVPADRRGVIGGLLNLSRNLGLITGASVLGAIFSASSRSAGTSSSAAAVTFGMHVTFAVATGLVVLALLIAIRSQGRPVPVSASA